MYKFSIIIPSRNRHNQLNQAIDSVICQNFKNIEIIVIIDGPSEEHKHGYLSIEQKYINQNIHFKYLEYRKNGHGPSFCRNEGVDISSGEYICFLDDDDTWNDPNHLEIANKIITNFNNEVDTYFSLQESINQIQEKNKDLWLSALHNKINKYIEPEKYGSYRISLNDLIDEYAFCHLNTTIIKKSFFVKIGGFDESLRYEEDRDLYTRIIDTANHIRYNPIFTAIHNAPDTHQQTTASTSIDTTKKELYKLARLEKQILFSKNKSLRHKGAILKCHNLKLLSKYLLKQGMLPEALFYAKQALLLRFDFAFILFFASTIILIFAQKIKRIKK